MGDYAPHEDTPENITVIEGDVSKLGITPENQAASEQVQPQSQRNVEEDLLKEQMRAESHEQAQEDTKEQTQEPITTEFEPQQIGGVTLTHYAEVDGKIEAKAIITEPNQELAQAMIEEAKLKDAENGISGNQAQYHRDLAVNDAKMLQGQAAVCVYIQEQHPDGNYSEAEAAKTEAQLAKYGFGLDSPSNSAEQQAQSQDVAQTTPHPMHSKIEALRQEMMYNKALNEANAMELTGMERNDYVRQEVREFMSKNDDKTYVAQELGGNEAKKNAYQDDINFGMGSPKGRN